MTADRPGEGSRSPDPTLRAVVLVLAILGFVQGALIGLVGALLFALW